MVSQMGAVERQVAAVRRRRNLFAAQQLLYVPVAITGGLLALLVGLAFVVPTGGYVFLVWAAIVAFAIGVVWSIRRFRASWLGADAIRSIDHSAHLEERLTTLTALAPRPVESRLWGHLVGENVRLLSRWTPQALTPRRIPRSLWPALAGSAVIGALLLLALAGGEADGGFMPRPGAHSDGSDPDSSELPPAGEGEGADGGPLVDWSQLLASMPEKLREEILRRAKRAVPGTDPPKDARPAGRGPSRGAAGAGEGSEPGDQQQRGAELARDSAGGGGKSKSPGKELARRERPTGGESSASKREEPAKGDGLKVLGQRPKTKEAGGASGGGPGAGAGAAGDALYGDKEADAAPDGIFALDLDAERGDGGDEGDEDGARRPDSPLASEQRIDDAVRRAQVPADYEKIVQRLFHRGDGEADAREVR